jgi:hypothetical protein
MALATAGIVPIMAQHAPEHAFGQGRSVGAIEGRGVRSFDQTRVPAQEVGRTFSRPESTFERPFSTFSEPSFMFPPFTMTRPNGKFFNRTLSPVDPSARVAQSRAALLNAAYEPYIRAVLTQAGLDPNLAGAPQNYSASGPYNGTYQFPAQRFAGQSRGPFRYGSNLGFGLYPFGWGGTPAVFVLNQPGEDEWIGDFPPDSFVQGSPGEFSQASMQALPNGDQPWTQTAQIPFDSQRGWTEASASESPLIPEGLPPGWVLVQAAKPTPPVTINFPPGARIRR